jgi:flagellin-like protein
MLFKTKIQIQKSVSPLIATILLIVVAVILVTVVLTWGKSYLNDSITATTDILSTYQEADVGFYLKVFRAGNGRIIVDYFPPSNNNLQDLNLVGYGLLGYTEHIVPFEPPILIEANKNGQIIDHGIMLDQFDLLLYTDDGYVITKKNIKQENLQPSNCPEGYIPVPGNHLYDTAYPGSHGFCVMKYEAKTDANSSIQEDCRYDNSNPDGLYQWHHLKYETTFDCNVGSYNIVSTPENYPVVMIAQDSDDTFGSVQACSTIPGGHLITNNEWMTIIRNIELIPSNWTGEEVGKGSIFRGNSSSSTSWPSRVLDGFDELSGINKRTLALTNNQVIWDLAGNVYNWTDDSLLYTIDDPPRFFDVNDSQVLSGNSWYDYSKGGGTGKYLNYNNLGNTLKYKDLFLLTSSYYNAENNDVGRIFFSGGDFTRVFARGGRWSSGTSAGVLALYLSSPPTYRSSSHGFRCVVVPQ